jgi:hypothetical protein
MDLSVAGSIASLVGLWLTFWAWRNARSARRAVQTWNLVEELERAALLAEDLFGFLRQGRFAESRLRCDELVKVLAEVPERRNALVDSHSRSELQQALIQAASVGERLNKRDGLQLSEDEQERLLGITQKYVTTRLRGIVGRAKSRTDERGRA